MPSTNVTHASLFGVHMQLMVLNPSWWMAFGSNRRPNQHCGGPKPTLPPPLTPTKTGFRTYGGQVGACQTCMSSSHVTHASLCVVQAQLMVFNPPWWMAFGSTSSPNKHCGDPHSNQDGDSRPIEGNLEGAQPLCHPPM